MLFQQIVQFELGESQPLIILEHVLLNPVIFMIKQKSPKQILE